MRLVHGRAATPDADRAATATMLDRTVASGDAMLRVWTPHRQVAFGRRDSHAAGYDTAREIAEDRGFPATERSVGGHAVAYTGTTIAFAHTQPIGDPRDGLQARYDATLQTLERALVSLGTDVTRGEPPESFCPGSHSLQADGKIVGIAQRVRNRAALVSGIVVVEEPVEIGTVLDPIYDALDIPFDPDSVGSISNAGGPADPAPVAWAIETAFVGDGTRSVLPIGRLSE